MKKGFLTGRFRFTTKGALVALILDLYIRKKTNHAQSLDDVCGCYAVRFGKPFIGYTLEDYIGIVEEVAGGNAGMVLAGMHFQCDAVGRSFE